MTGESGEPIAVPSIPAHGKSLETESKKTLGKVQQVPPAVVLGCWFFQSGMGHWQVTPL